MKKEYALPWNNWPRVTQKLFFSVFFAIFQPNFCGPPDLVFVQSIAHIFLLKNLSKYLKNYF